MAVSAPALVSHRPVVLAAIAGVYVGVQHARVLSWLARLPPFVEL
jgi:hypothetical protein